MQRLSGLRSGARARHLAAIVVASTGIAAVPLTAGAALAPGHAVAHSGNPPVLSTFENDIKNEQKLTFSATYKDNEGAGDVTTWTIDQLPPDALFISSATSEVFDLKGTYYACNKTGSKWSCDKEPSSLGDDVDPLAAAAEGAGEIISAALSEYSSHVPGLNVSKSEKSFAGQASTCATIGYDGKSEGEYCVTNAHGLLAYIGQANSKNATVLTQYSGNVSSKLFTLPKGAKIGTI